MSKHKDYVQIASTKTIMVTCGLQSENVTNEDAHIPDRLRVLEKWSKFSVLIKAGNGVYPQAIVNWATVQALVKDGILTIGQEVDNADAKAVETKERIDELKKEAKVEEVNLDAIAEGK